MLDKLSAGTAAESSDRCDSLPVASWLSVSFDPNPGNTLRRKSRSAFKFAKSFKTSQEHVVHNPPGMPLHNSKMVHCRHSIVYQKIHYAVIQFSGVAEYARVGAAVSDH